MQPRRNRDWDLPERLVTDETVFMSRRGFMEAGAALAGGALLGLGTATVAAADDPTAKLYPVPRNDAYKVDRPLTPETLATTYNNFYEFGSHKHIAEAAQALKLRPWEIRIDGLVEKPFTLAIDELIARMPLEERVYRLRCVEAWSMVVPWSGFPMKALLDLARPLAKAKYVRMETFLDKSVARGQRAFWYPWPYVEGLTMAEAANELAFLVTGLYGKPLPKQNGAPLRLAVPWKYGFKSIKSIVRFEFTDKRPKTFWEEVQGAEYGFWANVNPQVPHPRWSQATERVVGTDERIPTRLYNGYAAYVADLYKGLEGEQLFK